MVATLDVAGSTTRLAPLADPGQVALRPTASDLVVAQARSGSPLEQGEALRTLDAATGNRRATDAVARREQPAPEVCTIEVRFTPVAQIANHAFVITRDADSISYFRGGPSSREGGVNSGSSNEGTSGSGGSRSSQGDRNSGVYGTIETEHGAYRPRTIDWTTEPSGRQTVAERPGNCDTIDRDFARHADDIEAAHINYGPLAANSNSTAREILERGGFPGVKPVVWAPSWGIQLPGPR